MIIWLFLDYVADKYKVICKLNWFSIGDKKVVTNFFWIYNINNPRQKKLNQ